MPQFLGLDSSTQGLTAMVIDTDAGTIAWEHNINFGRDLPEYGCPQGFLAHPDPLVKHSDPLVWVAALDLVLQRGREQGCDWSRIAGISGSGQQHGSVYLNERWASLRLDPARDLVEQVRPCLSRPTAPIWMDSSTSAACAAITAAAGGDEAVTRISGSRAIERFTGPQIRKFAMTEPEAWAATVRVHLVSSFMASLLAGRDAPIDYGDGAGMNLLHLAALSWSQTLMRATAPDLAPRLPPVMASHTPAGEIAPYFVARYGFRAGTPTFAWSGDNPCSLVGMGATKPGVAVVSLGTSDTLFAAMSQPVTDPRGYGHVFGNPAGGFMSLICFKNGSLAREEVRNRLGYDWDLFTDALLTQTKPGNRGNLMLPYFVPEITPRILAAEVKLFGTKAFRAWNDAPGAVRAIVEAQALAMRRHADWLSDSPTSLLVTGGASRNRGILQVLADVFGASLRTLSVSNSACLGAAMRAAHGAARVHFDELAATFAAPGPEVIEPNPAAREIYRELGDTWAARLHETFGV